jgi:hypothetical protein
MEKTAMIESITEKAINLREELLNLEKEFNAKKEEFLKLQGALEALNELKEEEA